MFIRTTIGYHFAFHSPSPCSLYPSSWPCLPLCSHALDPTPMPSVTRMVWILSMKDPTSSTPSLRSNLVPSPTSKAVKMTQQTFSLLHLTMTSISARKFPRSRRTKTSSRHAPFRRARCRLGTGYYLSWETMETKANHLLGKEVCRNYQNASASLIHRTRSLSHRGDSGYKHHHSDGDDKHLDHAYANTDHHIHFDGCHHDWSFLYRHCPFWYSKGNQDGDTHRSHSHLNQDHDEDSVIPHDSEQQDHKDRHCHLYYAGS